MELTSQGLERILKTRVGGGVSPPLEPTHQVASRRAAPPLQVRPPAQLTGRAASGPHLRREGRRKGLVRAEGGPA